jgi:soluble lytic murein transglycosylase
LPKTDELDRTLLLAVIRQESQFYSKVVSGAGARGLMQLMPATAKRVARKLKIPYRRRKLTEDPTYNVRLGVAYLNQMLDRYDGSRLLALAAYNAGPRRVDRWIKLFGDPRKPGVDAVDWGERIPFNETRNYVQRILEAVPIYDLRIANRQVDLPLDWATAGFPDPH